MIQAFKGLSNCFANGYIKSHLNTLYVPYSKTTSARQLQEKCQEQNVDLRMTFIYLTKAFDSVSRDELMLENARGC